MTTVVYPDFLELRGGSRALQTGDMSFVAVVERGCRGMP